MTTAAAAVLANLDTNDTDLPTLLLLSRSAHTQYQQAKLSGLTAESFQWLMTAYRLRSLAHDRDPKHHEHVWHDEVSLKFKHADVMKFYEHELLKNG